MSNNNDSSGRRILPQSSQMSSFSFQPQQFPQRETQKNYVFVDEHNRHKRLKVMRACEGCRRRKIKCDAATTNTWPCSACIRLRLQCVRPNGLYEETGEGPSYETSSSATEFPDPGRLQEGLGQMPMGQAQQPMMGSSSKPGPSMYAAGGVYPDNPDVYQSIPYSEPQAAHSHLPYEGVASSVPMMDPQQYPHAQRQSFQTPQSQHLSKVNSPPDAFSLEDAYQQQDLSDLLGSLKMDEVGTAPYLRNKASFRREEEPAVEDADAFESALPPLIRAPGHKIRIPPELMPDDESALHYFDLFFAHVHPYVPVLNKSMFYQQWHHKRDAISPLIIEAIFAIGGRLADEPAQGQQWLALLSSHADSFMDVPRLSTLQALLIILKAREAAPKRGYYYRSWMTIVQCVQMGKDLGLDEHLSDHDSGRSCDSNPIECQLKTRIWQTMFLCELMVGSPQGRIDLSIDPDTVNFNIPRPVPGGDESDYHVSRNFTYLVRVAQNICRMTTIYGRLKKQKKKEWGTDPEFVKLNPALNAWLRDLPVDLSLTFPPDGSPPWLSSPFIGNLHSYYHLAVILLYRPQLAFLDPNGTDGQYKHHMKICLSSAKALCKCQEAVLASYGLTGLQCMQRGFSFSVYCGLACIVLHLVAMTSPDPELNDDARDFFTRHMRVMEKIMAVWPMVDLQRQVDAVREAFSADVRKPFALKPSFPYGSPNPSNTSSSSPGSGVGAVYRASVAGGRTGSLEQQLDSQDLRHQQQQQQQQQQPPHQVSYTNYPISPPTSAGTVDTKSDSPGVQSLVMMATQGSQAQGMAPTMSLGDAPQWNPQRIFDQWNTSFGTPQVQSPPSSASAGASSLNLSSPPGQPETPSMQDMQAAGTNVSITSPQQMAHAQAQAHHQQQHQQQQHHQHQQYSAVAPMENFVTPAMWQESVASVYEGGLKRAWDYDGSSMMKRTR